MSTTLLNLVKARYTQSHERLLKMTKDMTDHQLTWKPTPTAHSVGFRYGTRRGSKSTSSFGFPKRFLTSRKSLDRHGRSGRPRTWLPVGTSIQRCWGLENWERAWTTARRPVSGYQGKMSCWTTRARCSPPPSAPWPH